MLREGLSPAAAVLLLTVITIAAATLAYLWVTGYQKYLGPRAGEPHLREMLKIVSVELSDDKLVIHLQNIGETQAEVVAVYVYDAAGRLAAAAILPSPLPVSPGETKVVRVQLSSAGVVRAYTVKVTTSRGFEAVYAARLPGAVLSEWWNPAWRFRRPITVDNTGNREALADYQVLVVLDTASLISAGKMRADCGDIRFVDRDGNLLSYWVESGCNTPTTKVWVKVPSIPAGSREIIYVYYGNPEATSTSSGTATFDDFDDFSTNTLPGYVQIDTGWTISNGILMSPPQGQGFIYKPKALPRAYALRARIYISNRYLGDSGAGFIWGTAGGSEGSVSGYIANYYYSTQYSHLRRYTSGAWSNLAPLPTGIPTGWHVVEVRVNATTITVVRDDAYTDATARDAYYTTLLGVGFRQKAARTSAVDWWLLRKYSHPEPAVTIGAEESR